MYIVATGLGKTVIAARITNYLWSRGNRKFLVLCHAQDLALQLEQSFWREISKNIPTRTFFGGRPPLIYDGINFGLYQTFTNYLNGIEEKDFDVVIVDEAHHALANGFSSCLTALNPHFLVGMTATPWRGDGKSITTLFGNPIATVSLIDGMKDKYLAEVDYRLYCDKVVEGYISIAVVNLPYGTAEPQYIPIFVSEEINFNQIIFSGMGSTLIHPVTYTEGEYELLGDVD